MDALQNNPAPRIVIPIVAGIGNALLAVPMTRQIKRKLPRSRITVIARLEQMVAFVNRVFLDAPRLHEFFAVLDTIPVVRDRPDAIDPGRVAGRVTFDHVSFSYAGVSLAIALMGIGAAAGYYFRNLGPHGLTRRSGAARAGYRFLEEKYFLDRLYIGGVIRTIQYPVARGVYWFEVLTKGRIAHGSMPFHGVNAIAHMGLLLDRLHTDLQPRLAARTTAMRQMTIVPRLAPPQT